MATSIDSEPPALKRGLSWDESSVLRLETLANAIMETTDPVSGRAALETLFKMASNVQRHPEDSKYRQVRLANKAFSTKVWSQPAAQEFLFACEWTVVDDSLVLPSGSNLEEARRVLEKVICISEPPMSPTKKSPTKRTSKKDKQIEKEKKAREEHARRMKEEKQEVADKIKADRAETSQRPTRESRAATRSFGSDVKRFQDIGVDVNDQGG